MGPSLDLLQVGTGLRTPGVSLSLRSLSWYTRVFPVRRPWDGGGFRIPRADPRNHPSGLETVVAVLVSTVDPGGSVSVSCV